MRYSLLILIACLLGCTGVRIPSSGWSMVSSPANEAACFHQQNGPLNWRACSNLTGDAKSSCQAGILLGYDGILVPNKTKVAIYSHSNNGESEVLIQSGFHSGEIVFCETTHVMKF